VGVPEFQTARLILRPMGLKDAPALQRQFPLWENVRLLASSVPWPYPADGAETHVRDVALPAVERGEAWHWTIRLRTAPDDLIGAIGMMVGENENRGFWLAPQWRGQGLMTEAAERVTAFWFEELGMARLRVPKAAENFASRRVSEKQGMRVVALEERRYVQGVLPTEIWEITAEEWRDREMAKGMKEEEAGIVRSHSSR